MKPKRIHSESGNGYLPDAAPLANPYVPFQAENPPVYEARRGLIRGTLYPGLDLPFQGMVNTKELNVTPLTELQALAFAVQDLALYLDTHRCDQKALEQYQTYQKMYQNCVDKYEAKHGPLNHQTINNGDKYKWINDPWPWEYCKNKGVF